MESTIWVLIFSKFSDACNSLIDMIENANIQTPFQQLCIDNKQIRKIVQGSKKFNIKSVPCILNVNRTSGIVKQYEGIKAFELINSLIPPAPRASTPPPPVTEIEVVLPEIKDEKEQSSKSSTADDDRPSMVLKSKVSAKDIMAQNVTSIDDLNELPEKIIPPPIEQKKAGKPISVSEVMAAAQRGRT